MANSIELVKQVLISVGKDFGQDYDFETDSWVCKCGHLTPDNNDNPENYTHWAEHAAAALAWEGLIV